MYYSINNELYARAHDIVMIHEAPGLRESVQTAVKFRNIPGIIDIQIMVCMDIEEVFGETTK